jgi:choline dehydrogenase-like flavoprotein
VLEQRTYRPADEVDFVIVGSGAAGGVLARELSRRGHSVVVLEQGPWLTERDFSHDPLHARFHPEKRLNRDPALQPQTVRGREQDTARPGTFADYGRVVGGGTVHFAANYWRFPENEFNLASRFGVPAGSSLADWPITYTDLEPYYTRVDWEIGVSGLAGYVFEPPRSRGYPMPPLPIKSEGVLCERGAKNLGWHAWPAPMAILSQPYRGRPACVHCGLCSGYGCEVRAKSSTLVTMIPDAMATGRCEIRPLSYAFRVEMGSTGRVRGISYFDEHKREVFQRARAAVLSCNGVETPKLLLLSATASFRDGLANSSGQVGRNYMNNVSGGADALFEHEINAWKGVESSRVIWDFLAAGRAPAQFGGGGLILLRLNHDPGGGSWPDEPRWGLAWKKRVKDYFANRIQAFGIGTQLPVSGNRVDLDPDHKDAWGLPVPRLTFARHPLDTALGSWLSDRGRDLLVAAGATKVSESWAPGQVSAHVLGTCRMGRDPRTSVVDADHRAHDVANLFVVDGSCFVTSGPAPTMTIQALAFRAAERLSRLAKAGRV